MVQSFPNFQNKMLRKETGVSCAKVKAFASLTFKQILLTRALI